MKNNPKDCGPCCGCMFPCEARCQIVAKKKVHSNDTPPPTPLDNNPGHSAFVKAYFEQKDN